MSKQVNFSGNSLMKTLCDKLRPEQHALKLEKHALKLAAITGLALFIIACVGAAGAFPGPAIGWVTVGLGGGIFALSLAHRDFKNRKFELFITGLTAAALVTVGALGGTGVLSATQVGIGVIGTSFVITPIVCCYGDSYLLPQSKTQKHKTQKQ